MRKLTLFGYGIVRVDAPTPREEQMRKDFRRELDKKNTAILKLTAENRSLKLFQAMQKPFIDVEMHDPSPYDTEARKMYTASVAQFFKEIMRPKLLYMISGVREQLEKLDSSVDASGAPITSYKSNEFDKILKGTINALWLLLQWGEQMTSEQLEYQREITPAERAALTELAQ